MEIFVLLKDSKKFKAGDEVEVHPPVNSIVRISKDGRSDFLSINEAKAMLSPPSKLVKFLLCSKMK